MCLLLGAAQSNTPLTITFTFFTSQFFLPSFIFTFLRILSRVGIKTLRKKKTYLEWKVYRKASSCQHERFRWTKFLLKAQCFLLMAPQPLLGRGLLTVEASRLRSNTPQSEGLLWTSGQLVAETSTRQQTKPKKDRQPSMLPAGLEPAVPASERLQNHTLGSAYTGIGTVFNLVNLFIKST